MNQQNKPNWVLIGVLAVGIFLALRYFNNSPSPTPGNWAEVEAVAEKASLDYAELLSKDMKAIASKVERGDLKTSSEIRDYARKLTEESRNAAFKNVGVYDNKYITAKIEDPKLTSEYLEAKSRGHAKAAR